MEILILHRCVQGHEGALCFIITPLDYDGTAEAAVPEDFSLQRVQIIDFNLRFMFQRMSGKMSSVRGNDV